MRFLGCSKGDLRSPSLKFYIVEDHCDLHGARASLAGVKLAALDDW